MRAWHMKITQKKSSKKRTLIIISVLVILLICGGLYVYFFTDNTPFSRNQTSQDSKPKLTDTHAQPSDSDITQADELSKDPNRKKNPPNTDPSPQPSTEEPTGKASVQMVASVDQSDSTTFIRGGVNSSVSVSGTCYAQLSGPQGKSLRKDTTLMQNPHTTDCKTIAIDNAELEKGKWIFKLYYSGTDTEGVSNEVSFEIK